MAGSGACAAATSLPRMSRSPSATGARPPLGRRGAPGRCLKLRRRETSPQSGEVIPLGQQRTPTPTGNLPYPLPCCARVARGGGVTPEGLTGGGRRRAVGRTRDGLAYLWVEVLGRSGRHLAQALHIRPGSVYKGVRRAHEEGEHWRNVAGIYRRDTPLPGSVWVPTLWCGLQDNRDPEPGERAAPPKA